jgi:hypothetical protein
MKKFILILLLCAAPAAFLMAQENNKTPEQREKEMYEAIQAQVDHLTESLELEGWQTFYVDSILTHDYKALQAEIAALSASKVSNADLFYDAQDKWMEKMYQSLHKVFNEEQWSKYLRSGAQRDKKARDKRAAKKNK